MLNNIYQKNIDINNLGKHQRRKAHSIVGKNNKINQIEGQKQLIDEASMEDLDRKLLLIIKNYLIDILDNTYNAMINQIFV